MSGLLNLDHKVVAIGLGAVLALSVGLNIKQAFTARDLRTENRTLDRQLNDPNTGYIAKLGVCQANVATLSGGIDKQNAALAANAALGAAAVADATAKVASAQIRTAAAQRDAAAILANPPKGATTCERVEHVDRRIVESIP